MKSTYSKALMARESSYLLAKASTELKNRALNSIAKAIKSNVGQLLAANDLDCADSKDKISPSLYKRLQLDRSKIETIVDGVVSVSKLHDPVGATQYALEFDKGLNLYRISVPIGVIGVVFESRPDALVQISTLCLKSGNAVILKGGSEAKNTNKTLYEIIKKASEKTGVPNGWIQLVETRAEINELLKLDEYVDLMIPRGSNEFVRYIQDNTRIPVLGHSAGVCHVYVDCRADEKKAVDVVFDSKCQYPAVCNAMETLLIHQGVAKKFLPTIWAKLSGDGVEGKGDKLSRKIISSLKQAKESDWKTEYNNLFLNMKVVGSLEDAVDHINKYGSHHTDAIVTEDKKAAKYFIDSVDSASVMWNASTRFSDGFRYGLGAEVGISTNKVHARGPVGLEGLTTYKWILLGSGQKVADYKNKKYLHKKINGKIRI
ncbi:MAG: glutamate-5-semialdehyde dehydrogenase [Candidatus Altiarchaeota archaeon]|nr:glutamate-5-semialdehyde dehydrogenase [Candidatus Altiarchaeota archaeon]